MPKNRLVHAGQNSGPGSAGYRRPGPMHPMSKVDRHRSSVFREDFSEHDSSLPILPDTLPSTSKKITHSQASHLGVPEPVAIESKYGMLDRLMTTMAPVRHHILLAITIFLSWSLIFDGEIGGLGVKAMVLERRDGTQLPAHKAPLRPRDVTSTDVCSRWSQQSALINGTIYVYGGHATTQQGQQDNTWTNDFFSIDVTKSWDIGSPAVKGLPRPSGVPAVSNGYLWNSHDALFLYGGAYSDSPPATPDDFSLWSYDIQSGTWSQHQNPKTSAGNNSDPANMAVQRSAEGAGISLPDLGRGYYFAGHLDEFTTRGWSNQIARVYLKSLLEYTFPGFANNAVSTLGDGTKAGQDGVWRNITEGGVQDTAQFSNRADSAIVYVPGYGAQGILINTGGGTNVSFTQMNVIDVFDIATSTWYKQSTSGRYPTLRVNPCAVAVSAPDGTSTNVYVYGGQNLIPYKNQTQFADMWILTIPSFTWIQVDTTGQSVPPARVGHTCNVWDGQIVVVGGYNTDLAGGCESGFYVFNATNLSWQNKFNSLGPDTSGKNTQNKQAVQAEDPAALSGSNGYQVPLAVQKVVGGQGYGGATITKPAQLATAGPLATGKPITYTVTGANGAVITSVGSAGSGSRGSDGPNVGAIVAGVVAGCFAVLAAYLGFCAYIYRRQLALYKNHVAMTQRASASGPGEKVAFLGSSTDDNSISKGRSETDSNVGPTSGRGSTYGQPPTTPTAAVGANSIANSSTEDLMGEPSFFGVVLNPRRSLRVVNRD